jgi:putative ABC transport system substrate-binding protein
VKLFLDFRLPIFDWGENSMTKLFCERFFWLRSDNRKSKTCGERRRTIQNRKWVVIFAIVLTVALCGAMAHAQQPAKIPRIGFLFIGSKDQPHLESFRQGLRNLGYIEGKNILIEYRYADGKPDALPALAAELVGLNVDVILTTVPQASRAVLQATSTISIVVVGAGDPVLDGLVKSLARPGGNLTGLSSNAGPGMVGKQLELLNESVPKISVVAMLWNPEAGRLAGVAIDEAKTAAKALGLQIRPYEIKVAGDIDRVFDDLKKTRADALLIPGGPVVTRNSKRVAVRVTKLRLPSMSNSRQFVEDGGLMAYGVNFADLYRRAATYVDKILKGRKPADLPVEQPMKFELVVNLKAAKQIGVTIAPTVLARADEVIR